MPDDAATLDIVVETLSALPQVVGIGLGGSRTANLGDGASDHDLYVFGTAPVPLEVRRDLGLRFDPSPEIGNPYWGDEDAWSADGTWFDLSYWDTAGFEAGLRRVIEEHRPTNGYSTSFWYTARNLQPLFDRDGWLRRIGELAARPYPDGLANAIIRLNHPLLRSIHASYRNQVARAITLDDPVSVNHRVAELLKTAFDIVFAHHRQLHPGEKRQLQVMAILSGTERLDAEIRALLVACGSPSYDGLLARVDAVCDAVDAMLASGIA